MLFNRYLEPDVDLHTLQFTPQLTLSTSHEMRLPLRWIGILRDQVSLSLAASGGVQSAYDVVKLLLAGADVVMMTSTFAEARQRLRCRRGRRVVAAGWRSTASDRSNKPKAA